jgi:hypothetical protein
MPDSIRIRHSFAGGDLVALMAGLQQIYKTTGRKITIYQRLNLEVQYYEGATHVTHHEGNPVCMNEELFTRLWPLIDSQEYIEKFEIWIGQSFDWDIDLSRDSRVIPLPNGLIHNWAWAMYPEMACDLSVPWLDVLPKSIKEDTYKDKIIINRTQRYTNPYITYFFLREYERHLLFSGTEGEHTLFCKEWGLDIPHLKTDNFLQLAQIICWCKGGIYNQSLHFHIAEALKTPRILELCTLFPNTFPHGANGKGFYHQKSLELYFQNMING